MDAAFEIPVAGQYAAPDNIAVLNALGNLRQQRPRVADTRMLKRRPVTFAVPNVRVLSINHNQALPTYAAHVAWIRPKSKRATPAR